MLTIVGVIVSTLREIVVEAAFPAMSVISTVKVTTPL